MLYDIWRSSINILHKLWVFPTVENKTVKDMGDISYDCKINIFFPLFLSLACRNILVLSVFKPVLHHVCNMHTVQGEMEQDGSYSSGKMQIYFGKKVICAQYQACLSLCQENYYE